VQVNFVLPADGLFGGIRVLAIYAQRLAARGHKVTVVQPRHRSPSMRETFRSLKKGKGWPKNPDEGPSFFDTYKHENLTRIKLSHAGPITEKDVPDGDVVVASWWETAEWVWGLPATKGKKAHFMQDYEIWGGNVERVDATCRLPIPKIIIARWVEKMLAERFDTKPLAYVPNAVDTELFSAPPRGKQAVPTVGFTYTPMRNKGADIAIGAIERARKEIPDLKVVSFGSSQVAPELPLPVDAQFSFRVPDAALAGIYGSCDAWLFGTRIEGFGLPILEAMACRTPVIGTPAGAAPELLAKGGGILVGMEDVPGMANAIVNIARMPESDWKALSDKAHATACGYTWNDATDRFEAAITQVTRGEAPIQQT
jgi:glycosyltransferase involved in cell wall biosynthesis